MLKDLTADFMTPFDDPSTSSVFMPPFSESSSTDYPYVALPGYQHTMSSGTHIHSSDALSTQGVPSISDAYVFSSASTMYNTSNIPDGGQGGDVSGPYNDVYTDQDDMFGLYSC